MISRGDPSGGLWGELEATKLAAEDCRKASLPGSGRRPPHRGSGSGGKVLLSQIRFIYLLPGEVHDLSVLTEIHLFSPFSPNIIYFSNS